MKRYGGLVPGVYANEFSSWLESRVHSVHQHNQDRCTECTLQITNVNLDAHANCISTKRNRSCRAGGSALLGKQGFTLLEVIVALVIFASVGMAAFSWINTSFISMERIARVNDRSEMVVNGLELLRSVNPMLQPEGELETEVFRLSWQSEEYLGPENQERGLYFIAVYTVSAVMEGKNTGERFEFSFLQNGYQPQVAN